jgi:DNA-binding transcriptional regulator YhcF (GntR family)
MPITRAQEFQQWILAEIAKLPPDTCLPPDRELSVQWGLSTITVQRVLAKLRDEGIVIRIPGKGTFTPNRDKVGMTTLQIKAGTQRESSVEHLVSSLVRLISEGVYRKGKALPPVKFVRNQFKVSSETVTTAYQRLEQLGYVEKIGKSYWVGRLDQLMTQHAVQEVFFLRFGTDDFQDIFNSEPIALAFQKMERELYNAGYFLHPQKAENLPDLAREWEAKWRYPAGIVFYAVEPKHLPFLREFFEKHGPSLRNRVRILVHGAHGNLTELVPHAQVFLRGNVDTEKARVLAYYLLNAGYREANFCIDESDLTEFVDVRFFLKIALSVKNIIPDFVFRFVIRPKPGSTVRLAFADHLDDNYRTYLKSKYPNANVENLESHVSFSTDPFAACAEHPGTRIWIFFRDQMAAEAMDWLRARGKSVPQDVAIAGFQNDPRYYHLGISTCGPDWDNMGYVMAHAIVGDIKLAKSRKGFVKVRCHMVDKLTTPR